MLLTKLSSATFAHNHTLCNMWMGIYKWVFEGVFMQNSDRFCFYSICHITLLAIIGTASRVSWSTKLYYMAGYQVTYDDGCRPQTPYIDQYEIMYISFLFSRELICCIVVSYCKDGVVKDMCDACQIIPGGTLKKFSMLVSSTTHTHLPTKHLNTNKHPLSFMSGPYHYTNDATAIIFINYVDVISIKQPITSGGINFQFTVSFYLGWILGPILLTWFNFYTSMNK